MFNGLVATAGLLVSENSTPLAIDVTIDRSIPMISESPLKRYTCAVTMPVLLWQLPLGRLALRRSASIRNAADWCY
jgi:hypothetical protein